MFSSSGKVMFSEDIGPAESLLEPDRIMTGILTGMPTVSRGEERWRHVENKGCSENEGQ